MSDKETKPEPNDALIALIAADIPVAIKRLTKAQASWTSFMMWKKDGVKDADGKTHKLPVYDIKGQGPSVIPSELRTFLINIGKEQ